MKQAAYLDQKAVNFSMKPLSLHCSFSSEMNLYFIVSYGPFAFKKKKLQLNVLKNLTSQHNFISKTLTV